MGWRREKGSKNLSAQVYATVAFQPAGMRSGCLPGVLPSLSFLLPVVWYKRPGRFVPKSSGSNWSARQKIGPVDQDAPIYFAVQTQHLLAVVVFSSRRVTKILLPALRGRLCIYWLNAALSRVIEKGEQSLLFVEVDTTPSTLLDSYLPDLYQFPLMGEQPKNSAYTWKYWHHFTEVVYTKCPVQQEGRSKRRQKGLILCWGAIWR